MNLESPDSTLEIPHSKPLICLHLALEKSMVSFDLKISINSISLGLYPLQFLNAPVPMTFICILQLKNLHYVSTQELSTYYVGELFWSAFR